MRAATVSRMFLMAAALFLATFALSCGGGDDGGMTGGVVATFTPSEPSPTALEMTMQPGTVSGTTFNVRITATDVNDFFGAAFTVSIPNGVVFVAMDSTQSFLRDAPIPSPSLTFLADASTPNKIRVVATRLDATTNSGVNVVGTRDLVTLTLRATTILSASPIDFVSTDALEVRNSVQPPPEGGLIAVTWTGGAVVAAQQ